ncbi:hypothetical protein [Amycolatopsis sp. cg9]|uniref:hypothetical protein n=1 Tax=Amycolatopsis sp. cg9 TaxID=3238801 RepID=UPI003523BB03
MEQPGDSSRNTVRGDVHGTVVQAGTVYLGDVHHPASPERDFRADGLRALARRDYETAIADLTRAAPADPGLDFFLALALLRGNRPHRVRSSRELTAVRDRLRRTAHLPHARLLLLLTDEDRGRFWERGGPVSGLLAELVAAAGPDHVRTILEHVTAPENRVWRVLAASQGTEGRA